MNIIEAARKVKLGKRVFEPEFGWEVVEDKITGIMVVKSFGEPVVLRLDSILSGKWTVVDE